MTQQMNTKILNSVEGILNRSTTYFPEGRLPEVACMMTEFASYGGRQVLPVKCMTPHPFLIPALLFAHTGIPAECFTYR